MDLMTSLLVACAHSIQSCVAQRTFVIYYARLVVNSNLGSNWEAGEQVIQDAIVSMYLIADDPLLMA